MLQAIFIVIVAGLLLAGIFIVKAAIKDLHGIGVPVGLFGGLIAGLIIDALIVWGAESLGFQAIGDPTIGLFLLCALGAIPIVLAILFTALLAPQSVS